MKTLNQYIQEKLIINKDYHDSNIVVKSVDELQKIIEDRYDKLGPGPNKKSPIDFNDIDVSNLDSFCSNNTGIFEETKFKYIDISDWDVSNVTDMRYMFYGCDELKSVRDISGWDVSKVTDMMHMFDGCEELESIGDISKWNVSNVISMTSMFDGCKSFNQDISNWNVSNVRHHEFTFYNCSIKDEYKPKFK